MLDSELVHGIMQGQVDYAVLVHRFEHPVCHWIRALVGNSADAEEVTECLFTRVYERLDRYDPTKGSLYTWLHTIAHNMAVSFLRKRNRAPASLDAMTEDEAPTVVGPEEMHDARERWTRLRRLVRDLESKKRHAFLGHFVRGLKWTELAAEMDCCERSVRGWAYDAIAELKKEL